MQVKDISIIWEKNSVAIVFVQRNDGFLFSYKSKSIKLINKLIKTDITNIRKNIESNHFVEDIIITGMSSTVYEHEPKNHGSLFATYFLDNGIKKLDPIIFNTFWINTRSPKFDDQCVDSYFKELLKQKSDIEEVHLIYSISPPIISNM